MYWNQEFFPGMTANPVWQMQKLNHSVRVTCRFIFQAKQKKESLWSLLSNENCMRKCSSALRNVQRGPLHQKKSPRPLAMTLGSVLKDSGLNYVCAAARTAARCFNILNHYHIRYFLARPCLRHPIFQPFFLVSG